MKSKLSWIAFIPLTLLALAIKLAQIFYTGESGTLFGLTSFQLSYVAIGAVVLILLLTIVFAIADKKTAPYYSSSGNVAAGIFALLVALVMACDGANRIFNIVQLAMFEVLPIIDAVITLVSAVVFVVIGLSRFTGSGTGNGLALFFLIPSIWSAVKLISTFLTFTTVSIYTVDVTKLVGYVFLTLFLFNYAILISKLQGKSPVKMTLIYGFPACTALLCYSVYELVSLYASQIAFDFFGYAECIELALLALFILTFLIELTIRLKTKDEVRVIEEEEAAREAEELEIEEFDKSFADQVITGLDNDTMDNAPVHSYFETQDTSDFIYQVTPLSDESNKTSVRYGNLDYNEIDDYITSLDNDYDRKDSVSDQISPILINKRVIKQTEEEEIEKASEVSEKKVKEKSGDNRKVQEPLVKKAQNVTPVSEEPAQKSTAPEKNTSNGDPSRMDEIDRLIAEISNN